MTMHVLRHTSAATGLRARWTVDPTDSAGRRMIAVWARPGSVPAGHTAPATALRVDGDLRVHARTARRPAVVHLPSKGAVLRSLSVQIADHWPRAS